MEEERIIVEQANLEYFRKALRDNTFISWIALDNEEIIATSGLSFSVVPPLFQLLDGKVAYIMNMVTSPSHHNRGIGTKLCIFNKQFLSQIQIFNPNTPE